MKDSAAYWNLTVDEANIITAIESVTSHFQEVIGSDACAATHAA